MKIAAAITAGKTVLYLAPTHAFVGQVEQDRNERIGDVVTAESVEDATSVDDLRFLPALAVLIPESAVKPNFTSPILTHPSGLLDELGVPLGRASDFDLYRMRRRLPRLSEASGAKPASFPLG